MSKNISPKLSTTIAESKNYFPFIDGLRGIAILMVVAVHTSQKLVGSYYFPYSKYLVNSGARGVQLFFMVSAFTLFSSSFRRFKADKFPVISFYIRRAFRILPFWWLMVIVFGLTTHKSVYQMLPSLLFYFGILRFDAAVEVVPGGWSLFVEECFYLLLPLIFTNITNIKRSFIFVLICLSIYKMWNYSAPILGVPNTNSYIFLFPFNQWHCFAIGIFIYFLVNNKNIKGYRYRSSELVLLDVLTLLSLLAFIVVPLIPATLALSLLFFASANEHTICGKLTRNKILMRFGGYCYSIYLFHFLLLDIMDGFKGYLIKIASLDNMPKEIGFVAYFPIVSFVALCIGFISFNLIEKPCVNLGKKFILIVDRLMLKTDKIFMPEKQS